MAILGEVLSDGIGDFLIRHPVNPRENEGLHFRIMFDLGNGPRTMKAAVFGNRKIAIRQVRNCLMSHRGTKAFQVI